MRMETFGIAAIVIEEATERFTPHWTLNKKNYKYFEGYCSVIDKFLEKNHAVSLNVSVDESTMQIKFEIESDDVVVCKTDSSFLALVELSIKYGFYQNEEGNVVTSLKFPSLWDRVIVE